MNPAAWTRQIWSVIGIVVAYYAVPVEWDDSLRRIVLSMIGTICGLGLLARMMVLELQNLRHGREVRSVNVLSLALVMLVMSFAFTFYLVNLLAPGQIVGLSTRTDALYFTLATMTTVGYGDVHAVGQLARALVCGLIVFNVVVVTSLVRAYTRLRNPSV